MSRRVEHLLRKSMRLKTVLEKVDPEFEYCLMSEFSAAELERALYTKELLGLNTPVKRPPDASSPPPTEPKRRKSTTDDNSKTVGRKVELKGKSAPQSSSRRSSSRIKTNSTEMKMESSSESAGVSSADKAIGVPRVGIGVIVLNKEDQVLIGKRKSPHGQGMSPSQVSDNQVLGHYLVYSRYCLYLTLGTFGIL